MRQNYYFSMQPSQRSRSPAQAPLQLQNEITFPANCYYFPNDHNFSRQHTSFKTLLPTNRRELPDHYAKRLSMLNRSQFTIKLKQIKKEEYPQEQQTSVMKLLLYYEPVPFSLTFAKQGPLNVSLSSKRFERILREVFNDLVQNHIYHVVTLDNCGFSQTGEFRVFIPPASVLKATKLTKAQKHAIFISVQDILKYWDSDLPKTMEYIPHQAQIERKSTRFHSPKPRQPAPAQEQKRHKNSEETIKLSKTYTKLFPKKQEQPQNMKQTQLHHELKKHKSLDIILPPPVDIIPTPSSTSSTRQPEAETSHFISKINQLNKKLHHIKQNFIKKRSSQEYVDLFRKQPKYQPQLDYFPSHHNNKEYQDEIIFDKYQDEGLHGQYHGHGHGQYESGYADEEIVKDEGCDLDDTYLQEMGYEDHMPSFKPNSGMRKTALPLHLQQAESRKLESQSNWHHQSAGNLMFKRFIQKNKDAYPEMFDAKDNTYLSKVSVSPSKAKPASRHQLHHPQQTHTPKQQQQTRPQIGSQSKSPSKLKKIMSMETFQNHCETNSVHLSECSQDQTTAKRRKQKQAYSRHIKQKVQDILKKSKKTIELLKSPSKKSIG